MKNKSYKLGQTEYLLSLQFRDLRNSGRVVVDPSFLGLGQIGGTSFFSSTKMLLTEE